MMRIAFPGACSRMWLFFLVTCACAFWCGESFASTFTTRTFTITINVRCTEPVVGCDDVDYLGINRKTGKAIRLKGKVLMSICADGVTPCHFQGYQFKNGPVTYDVILQSDSWLEVRKANKVLLHEELREENSGADRGS